MQTFFTLILVNLSISLGRNFHFYRLGIPWFLYFSENFYKIFNLRNNGYDLGGKLRVTFDRYLIKGENNDIFLTNSAHKVEATSLDDITLRVGVMVSHVSILNPKNSFLISCLDYYQ